jgi:hypothetical protein
MTPIRHFGWAALALFALVGCEAGQPAATPPATPSTGPAAAPAEVKPMPTEPAKTDEPKKEADAAAKPLTSEELAEIKKLPAEEQPIAIAQASCPVSGDHLGEMGAPIKQVVGDKTFFLCCAGCEKAVKANPDKVLADLAKLKK